MKTEVGIEVNEEIVSAFNETIQDDTVIKEEFKCGHDEDYLIQMPIEEEGKDECEHCEKLLAFHSETVQHVKRHNDLVPFHCASCSKSFEGIGTLNLDVCDTQSSLLKQHDTTNGRQSVEKTFTCGYCGRLYHRKHHLIVHIRNHIRIRRLNLNYHMKMHINEQPHKCNTCDKRFKQKHNLNRHMKVHTNERSHKCNFCDKCFKQNGHLKEHIKIHTKERSHKCNFCDKCFIRKCNLNSHMKVHTNERPYKCNPCNKCFKYKNNLYKHQRTHTNE